MDKYRIDYFQGAGAHEMRYYLTLDAARLDAAYIKKCLADNVFVLQRVSNTDYFEIVEML